MPVVYRHHGSVSINPSGETGSPGLGSARRALTRRTSVTEPLGRLGPAMGGEVEG